MAPSQATFAPQDPTVHRPLAGVPGRLQGRLPRGLCVAPAPVLPPRHPTTGSLPPFRPVHQPTHLPSIPRSASCSSLTCPQLRGATWGVGSGTARPQRATHPGCPHRTPNPHPGYCGKQEGNLRDPRLFLTNPLADPREETSSPAKRLPNDQPMTWVQKAPIAGSGRPPV